MDFKKTANKIIEEKDDSFAELQQFVAESLEDLALKNKDHDQWRIPLEFFDTLKRKWSELSELSGNEYDDSRFGSGYEGSSQEYER
tara:strand:- start:54 stop:311 length:258 start_codon:yes stop_codon:yes gene_type:complete